jgi:hypothetical protein
MIEFKKEKIILPFWRAFSSFRNLRAKATIKKLRQRRKKIRVE